MTTMFPSVTLTLPDWTVPFIDKYDFSQCARVEARMRFALALARENIRQGTGGPFGAAIFDCATHKLIAPGINLVLSSQCSVLHAEIVAIMIAQKISGSFDLGKTGLPALELVTSTEPCAMCLGALPWSGIKRLVCGGRDADARAIGFDEGAKVNDWVATLEKRGIKTTTDVCREEAQSVFTSYLSTGGIIYNSRNG
jgi:tRNA(Arg) A34 adenosine deaminase TadA